MGEIIPPKILVIGIDGATFSLISPWADSGELPNLKRLMDNGAWGNLGSTIPPITAPAWTSFMTGKNPGKHGLYHFISPKPDTYDFHYTNASSRRSRTIWRILSDHGARVGVFNVPMTYPPETVNGYMISGLDTPSANSPFIYPDSLRQELLKEFGSARLDITHLEFMRTDSKKRIILKEMAELEDHRAEVAEYLIKKHPVDIFMLVFCSVDQIQHYFWKYMDEGHYMYQPGSPELFSNAILSAYKKIDSKIGLLLNMMAKDSTVIIMSDHGAGPSSDKVLYLNHHLSDVGVLKFKDNIRKSPFDAIIRKTDPFLRKTLSPNQKKKIAALFPGIRRKWERGLASFADIDWSGTKAFCYDVLPAHTNIWINIKGKFPQGNVNSGTEYEELMKYITEKLYGLKNPENGRRIIDRIYRKEDIYSGAHTELAPDLTLSWWDGDGFTIRPGRIRDSGVVRRLGQGFDSLVNWSGTHRINGVMILNGPPFKEAKIPDGAEIVDLAPTLLYLMGCPVPDDMDGKVMTGVFRDDYLSLNPVKYSGPEDGDQDDAKTEAYSDAETEKVKERLKALGYLG